MIPSRVSDLDFDQFLKPDPFYWSCYMWIWNDCLTNEELRNQLQEMVKQNAFAVMPVPEPKKFRPHRQPTRLSPEYLSSDYFKIYSQMVKEAHKLNMQVWLYDEGGWPSGSICGELVKNYPLLKAQTLRLKKKKLKQGKKIKITPNCICAIVMQGSKKVKTLMPNTSDIINIPNLTLWTFSVKYNKKYPDLLNPDSTQKFLEMTHHKYNSAIGDSFGSTICLTFTDEPKIIQLPWTEHLIEDFKIKKGYDLREHLPSLFNANNEEDKKILIDYYDWWSQQFASNYFGQIQSWCHQHNLLSAGHLGGEDETINAIMHGFGHVLRPLRLMDIPGVDAIWRQLWPGKNNHHFPRYASTAAHQGGHKWALSESFAVYGSGLTPAQMKWIVNYQFVRGINLFNFATYQYSNKDWFIGGERPVMGPINPLWSYMSIFHSYVARLSYILSLGEPLISVCVYYPVRDLWAGGEDAKRAAESNDKLVNELESMQIDFDFIDDDVIASSNIQSSQSFDKPALFCIGPMKYSKLIITHTKWLPESSIQKLNQFIEAGGKIYYWDDVSGIHNKDGEIMLNKINISKEFLPLVQVNPSTPKLKVSIRQLPKGLIYFLTNEDTKSLSLNLTFNESQSPLILDPELGIQYIPNDSVRIEDKWQFPWNFSFGGSLVVAFITIPTTPIDQTTSTISIDQTNQNHQNNLTHSITQTSQTNIILDDNWTIRKLKEFKITRRGINIKKIQDDQPKVIELGDWQESQGNYFSGECEYKTSFCCKNSDILNTTHIDLGEVNFACEVILNNKSLGKKCWSPYIFYIPENSLKNSNELSVLVSNTLANQYQTTRFWTKWSKRRLGPYHPMTLKFEKESVKSGLFGPIKFY